MTEETNHTAAKSRRKWPWIILGLLVLLVITVRLALMSSPVHRWAKHIIIEKANKQLKPTLSIGHISGDLWDEATLTNLKLTEQDSTVASIDTLHVEYKLLSYFADAFKMPKIQMVNPFIAVKQRPDSSYNLQHWMQSSSDTSSTFAVSVSHLNIDRGQIHISRAYAEPRSFSIDDVNLRSGINYHGDKYSVDVSKFNFKLKGTPFSSPVAVNARAKADEHAISLQKLAIATAHSALHASGKANLVDSTGHVEAAATPLGWQDIAAYADSLQVHKDMNLKLAVTADSLQIKTNLTANANGINQLKLQAIFRRGNAISLRSARITAQKLDLASFFSDTTMPQLKNLTMEANGSVPLENYKQGHLKGTISANHIQRGTYKLDALNGSFAVKPHSALLRVEPQQLGETIIAEVHVSRLWQPKPSVVATVKGHNINPEKWLPDGDKSMKGDLTFSGRVSGEGWYPQQSYWDYRLRVDQSSLMNQPVGHVSLAGRFNRQNISNQTKASLKKSTLHLTAEVHHLQKIPSFTFNLKAHKLDLSQIPALGNIPSLINGSLQGRGTGSSLQNMKLRTSLQVDSSVVKGEKIKAVNVNARLSDSLIIIPTASIKSSVANGSFQAHLNPFNFYDPDNKLKLNVQLKDISPLASLVNARVLQAKGSIQGNLGLTAQDSLTFNASVDLHHVNYDEKMRAKKITGNVGIEVLKDPHYKFDLDINEPTISSKKLRHISVKTQGLQKDSLISGSYAVNLSGAKKASISQAGTYQFIQDSVRATVNHFKLAGPEQTLAITQPLHVSYAGGKVQTDTLRLQTAKGAAYVALAIPFADSVKQKGFFKTDHLNIAGLQQMFLDHTYIQGTLSGHTQINRTDTSLTTMANLVMSNIKYKGVSADSLHVKARLKNDRLQGNLTMQRNGKKLVEGHADIPFEPQSSHPLGKDFLNKPLNGYLRVRPVSLDEFSGLLKQMGIKNTKGLFQFNGQLSGKAGHPKLNASLSLKNAELSGVPVQAFTAAIHYAHADSNLALNATLNSMNQKTVAVDAKVPFKLNLQNLNVSLPAAQDPISVDLQAKAFKLKSLNDFVNADKYKNVEGLLNGEIHISGPRDNLHLNGKLQLQNGAFRIVGAGIRLDKINSMLQFDPDKIVIQQFTAHSGSGSLSASGKVGIKKLAPGSIDVEASARNFKIANTDKYNGIIDMNMKAGGTVSKPKISGKLNVVSGFVKLSNFGGKSVEDVQLDTTLGPQYHSSLYDSLSLDMKVQLNPRFTVRNKRYLKMNLKMDGSVDLRKKPGQDLQLFGTLKTAGGYAEPLGKHFELQKGSLAFSGPSDNPQIDIRTLYKPPQTDQKIKIYYIIEGTVKKPKFMYESDPKMDLTSIISYTLFGEPYYKLTPGAQGVASSSSNNVAADFAMEVVMNRLEALATSRLGIDVVRIDNTHVGGKAGTSITTGWYLKPKVFFAIQNVITGSTPTTGFYLEYFLQKNLKLILQQAYDNQQGVDLQWDYDY